ncbi:hypothetical protein [Candidatus Nitrotoga fabula]|uniref:Uncharacterized protein n=1 Tax=Candidatus Nitrotoga fabula TaxID=2182327 RepID=A0A916BBM3_9PROT|nr:conserved hypothetical protein [Candidatus Nitrotoga fabula]
MAEPPSVIFHEPYRDIHSMATCPQTIWRSPSGEVVACVEKIKVLNENMEEIRQICQDALEDAVLMGCDEQQFRAALIDLVQSLINPYLPEN